MPSLDTPDTALDALTPIYDFPLVFNNKMTWLYSFTV